MHRFVEVNGVGLHIAEQGHGSLVLLLHGWPESWYSWRHQFGPLATAGYRVVAPDQRGYARSEQPPDVGAYTLLHLVGDAIALIDELGEEQAILVGHDWGAPIAWTVAMLRPNKVRAVGEILAFTVPENTRSRAVMERIGMTRSADDDFEPPALPEGHRLRRHVLYRIGRGGRELETSSASVGDDAP